MQVSDFSGLLKNFGFQMQSYPDFESFLDQAGESDTICQISSVAVEWHIMETHVPRYLEVFSKMESVLKISELPLCFTGRKTFHVPIRVSTYSEFVQLVAFLNSGFVDAFFWDGLGFQFPRALARINSILYQQDEDYISRLSDLKNGLLQNPDSALLSNMIGKVLMEQNQTGEASKYFVDACEKESAFAEAHSNMGVLMWQNGHKAESFDLFCSALQCNPFDTAIQDNFINTGTSIGAHEKMLTCLEEINQNFKGYVGLYYLTSLLLLQMGRREDAKDKLFLLIRSQPNDKMALSLLEEISGGM